jgi:phage/plasmid-like protein (TIGR03299 family)
MSANVNTMMYVGEKPWHGLGVKLEKAATSAEAITAAGLDWAVEKRPVTFLDNEGKSREVPGKFVTVRADTQKPLGVVGSDWTPIQNREAFSFFDAVVGEKLAIYHTAGALGDGQRVWILAKLPGHIRVIGDDVVEKFLLLSNGHDGGLAYRMGFTPIRVVCQNTLNIALKEGSILSAKLRHTSGIGLRVNEVREQLGIVAGLYQTFEELSKRLVQVPMSVSRASDFFKGTIIPKPKEGETELGARSKKMLEDVLNLFEHGRGNDLPGVKGTAWAAFNAVTEFADYRPVRGGDEASRAHSILWGYGADIKQRAWDAALALAK